ncbi:MAG: Ppx/GppA family phosphatase [Gammaproteobacteria bacterium]|nr:Ppx/GppA family phosphatase [Gammaproteobacteria bacterium]
MIVARLHNGQLIVIDKLREMVRLAEGISCEGELRADVAQRAIDCLKRFGQRLHDFPSGSVRAVGTNTLRNASQAGDFILRAEEALGHPIDIITGVEEARLIYLGVSHGIAEDSSQRLVMDIGGGSTELIVGKAFAPRYMESLEMGCVSITQQFFPEGKINEKRINKALLAASLEVAPHKKVLKQLGWKQAIGASGTIRATRAVLLENGWSHEGIPIEGLRSLVEKLATFEQIDEISLPGLTAERAPVFLGGVLVLLATFEKLHIERMIVSDCALREGLLHDLQGRIEHEDTRAYSVTNMVDRYHIDQEQAKRVTQSALYIFKQLSESWSLDKANHPDWINWAAQLHEIGLDIAHKHYHLHGAYIIEHSDLAGFSQQEQRKLALLIRLHRRKFQPSLITKLPQRWQKSTAQMAIILRLAFILNRSRNSEPAADFTLKGKENSLHISFPKKWLEQHPLTQADLEQEALYLDKTGFTLEYQ